MAAKPAFIHPVSSEEFDALLGEQSDVETTDIIIVGLGAMGSAAAYHLASNKVPFIGFEKFSPAHALGSSHGGSRIIRQAYFEHPDYVPLLIRAYELWRELDEWNRERGGEQIVHITGGLYFGSPTSTTVAGSLLAAQEWKLDHEVLSSSEIKERFPFLNPGDEEIGVFESIAGFVRPETTVLAHIDRSRDLGADLRFNDGIEQLYTDGKRVFAVSENGEKVCAKHAIMTPGAWAPQTCSTSPVTIPMVAERQVMYWFNMDDEHLKQWQTAPVFVHELPEKPREQGAQIYGFPASDGSDGYDPGAKIAFFRWGQPTDPDTINRDVSQDEITRMQNRIHDLMPGHGKNLQTAKACMYTTTPDEHFCIGTMPDQRCQNITIGCGFSGHGFKFVPVVGEILAQLAVDGSTSHPIDLFAPDRFTEVQAAADLLPSPTSGSPTPCPSHTDLRHGQMTDKEY